MQGNATRSGTTQAWCPLQYSVANALAATQQSVTGQWVRAERFGIGLSFTVDSAGALTGSSSGASVGVCKLTGNLQSATPGSAKNMYVLSLNAQNAAVAGQPACKLDTTQVYRGPSALVLRPAGTYVANGYLKDLTFLIRTNDFSTLSATLSRP